MTSAPGRPLRCFSLVLLAWIAIRMGSPGGTPPFGPVAPPALIATAAAIPPLQALEANAPAAATQPPPPPIPKRPKTAPPPTPAGGSEADPLDFTHLAAAFAPRHRAGEEDDLASFPPGTGTGIAATPWTPLPVPLVRAPAPDRWRGSAWMLWRPDGGGGEGAVPAGRLGGSQAGVRVDYDLTPSARGRLAAYTRVTSALQRPAAPEAALGLAFQPTRTLPVSLAVERRAALGDGARNATAAMAVGGFGPTPVVPGVEALAYAQAGVVGLRRKDGFIDGKLSLAAPVAGTKLRLGAAVSGGAQPGVASLDIGPEARLRVPLPRVPTQLSLEWRHRVGGDARPRSGLALTLGADF
ncbi:hypothetical protein [Sphingobium sp.]|uniref:hypothetical protein n=1 Tax=Sphingobium sp. TaxID=1912891 RepID=UPI0025D95B95|nr:hypothetical protein [Sphingobium sp.]